MTLVIDGAPDGWVKWELIMPPQVLKHIQSLEDGRETFEVDPDTSLWLIRTIDAELAREHLCPGRWTFLPGFKRKGTMVFVGECLDRVIKG